eukprot:39437-Hanusia_phi.AAC.1
MLSARIAKGLKRGDSQEMRGLLKDLGFSVRSMGQKAGKKAEESQEIVVVDSWDVETALSLISACPTTLVRGVEWVSCCRNELDMLLSRHFPCAMNSAFKEDIVSFSGMSVEEKEALKFQVVAFGGKVEGDFHEGVGIIIAKSADTQKSRVAIARHLQGYQQVFVVKPEWLSASVKKRTRLNPFDFRFKLWSAYKFSVSGMELQERLSLEEQITFLGGQVSPQLDESCTALITCGQKGPKYEFALRKGIPIIPKDTLLERLRGGSLDIEDLIPLHDACARNSDDEVVSTQSSCADGEFDFSLDFQDTRDDLQDCKIFVMVAEEKIRNYSISLCRLLGATLIQPDAEGLPRDRNITHIVTSKDSPSDLHKLLEYHENSVPFVDWKWLKACYDNRSCSPIADFLMDVDAMAIKEQSRSVSSVVFARKRENRGKENIPSNLSECFEPANEDSKMQPAQDVHEPRDGKDKIFTNCSFCFNPDCQDQASLKKMIQQNGGTIVEKEIPRDKSEQVYEIHPLYPSNMKKQVPIFGSRSIVANKGVQLASEYWVRKCAAVGKRFPLSSSPLHKPLRREKPSAELQSLSVCVSGVYGHEKNLVRWLTEQVGGSFVEKMSRKSTSHLVLVAEAQAGREKAIKAKEWGIGMTSLAWLEASAVKDAVAPVSSYPVGSSLLPEMPGEQPKPLGQLVRSSSMQKVVNGTTRRLAGMSRPALFGDEMKELYASSPDKLSHAEKENEEEPRQKLMEEQVSDEATHGFRSPAGAEGGSACGQKREASIPTPDTMESRKRKRIGEARLEDQIPFLLR